MRLWVKDLALPLAMVQAHSCSSNWTPSREPPYAEDAALKSTKKKKKKKIQTYNKLQFQLYPKPETTICRGCGPKNNKKKKKKKKFKHTAKLKEFHSEHPYTHHLHSAQLSYPKYIHQSIYYFTLFFHAFPSKVERSLSCPLNTFGVKLHKMSKYISAQFGQMHTLV